MELAGLSSTAITIMAAIGGLIVGWLFGRQTSAGQSRSKTLEKSLRDAEQKLSDYQDEVQTHFKSTAEAFEQVNDSYLNLQEKLVQGANSLCTDLPEQALLGTLASGATGTAAASMDKEEPPFKNNSEALEPPRDYAPRKDPNEKGMLTEDFGLEKPGAGAAS